MSRSRWTANRTPICSPREFNKVLDAADTDNDKKSTWGELAANEEFLKAENALNPNYAEEPHQRLDSSSTT